MEFNEYQLSFINKKNEELQKDVDDKHQEPDPPKEFLFVKEEDVMKFYYFEAEDRFMIGKRCGTMYYADIEYIPVHDCFCLTYTMSRYLPWGLEGYPPEPKEITFEEWLVGFMKQLHQKGINIS